MAARVERLMGIDLVDLELFAQVVDAGSITEGAQRVHLALPSASARIRLMEKALRTPLLRRGRRGVTPTAAGHLLLRH
ncbi:MAG TPA: LysR family transcriptional regulator, partial [Pseudonocardiaceae bacterium]